MAKKEKFGLDMFKSTYLYPDKAFAKMPVPSMKFALLVYAVFMALVVAIDLLTYYLSGGTITVQVPVSELYPKGALIIQLTIELIAVTKIRDIAVFFVSAFVIHGLATLWGAKGKLEKLILSFSIISYLGLMGAVVPLLYALSTEMVLVAGVMIFVLSIYVFLLKYFAIKNTYNLGKWKALALLIVSFMVVFTMVWVFGMLALPPLPTG